MLPLRILMKGMFSAVGLASLKSGKAAQAEGGVTGSWVRDARNYQADANEVLPGEGSRWCR